MRDVVRVQMTKDQLEEIRLLLATLSNKLTGMYAAASIFMKTAEDAFTDCENRVDRLIEVAKREYEGDEIHVDDDAPFSETDSGTWVGAWVFVSHEDEDSEGDDDATD